MEQKTKMLAKKLKGNIVQCLACNRYCKIPEGQAGFCGVRVNEDSELKLSVYGKPCAVWIDPIEKKPLFHFLPGSRSFSIGTFGCNFSCQFCFTPENIIINDDSVKTLEELFADCENSIEVQNGTVGFVKDRYTYSTSGRKHKIAKVFRHFYSGKVLSIKPRHLSQLTCTPEHSIFVYRNGKIEKMMAQDLKINDYLVIPKLAPQNDEIVLDSEHILEKIIPKIKKSRKLKLGIPKKIKVDERFAELLGYYCANGHAHKLTNKPLLYSVVFLYGKREKELADRTKYLIEKIFGLKATIFSRKTTQRVEIRCACLGELLSLLCGKRADKKVIPNFISKSNIVVISAFLKTFIKCNGYIKKNSIAINTISRKLAFGIYHLFLLLGYLPSFYVCNSPTTKSEENIKFKETEKHWLVPIFRIEESEYSGFVYNCEVEEEHSYLANFIGVANCQNSDISQAPQEARMRDPAGWRNYFQNLIDRYEYLAAETVVENAIASGCKSISFTYNEPTIFSEYAIDIMKIAKKKGLKGVYVTNGYESEECWDAIRGYIDAANIDLKAYNQKFYTELCKVPNFELVKESITYAKKLGIWVEVTTLLIPDWNDDEKELAAETKFLATVDRDMPWHVTAFHPDYKLQDKPSTQPETLIRAREIGKAAGIKHVYCGNVASAYASYETTICQNPKCGKELITRIGFSITNNNIIDGKCRFCKQKISGVWR